LLNNLKNFARDEINDETMELLEPYMKYKEDWFNFPQAKNASVAAAGILSWSLAIAEYHEKSKIVKPK
jgi:dynein heavy chain